ncbi:YdcF family protein [Mycobacterium sp. CVI_P3]|uniref:YdcF family protein n=1 Tax=Mycobacterium pinniadriaticum TaxID=2994102 RepID=A0ABT3SKM7_9MYCO|nr:YdcF family protein [Mycobacterium pinniadriaticum]MCX2933629.1 YdcF family protein [Mycobacterium pinniadriaticum]MCX2940084.1 YdcF family protein [Mycobacterium pinniadriaticum]
MGRWRRALAIVAVIGLGIVGILGVTGYFLFNRPRADPLTKADAIIVLGGDNDGRLEYGLSLAEQGYADTVVLSNAYSEDEADSADYRRACASGTPTVTVICFRPVPFTTRGEAMYLTRLAKQHHWTRVIVVSWNYHMVRARYIFHQCFDGSVTMRPVPRTYDYPLWYWAWEYAYQYTAMIKAFVLGCHAR